jgi:hypothetical protein
MQDIITLIENACALYFEQQAIKFVKSSYNIYVISGSNFSQAINNRKNDKNQITVLNWFYDFWVYIELKFVINDSPFPQSFISVSIFQGEASDEIKNQLFRAEWDNHDDNLKHPQPHWHIYPFKYSSKYYEDFEAYNNMLEESEDSFSNEIASTVKDKIVDIRNFHFAMEGRWSSSESSIHKVTDGKMIANWMSGLLGGIREQLEYIM